MYIYIFICYKYVDKLVVFEHNDSLTVTMAYMMLIGCLPNMQRKLK